LLRQPLATRPPVADYLPHHRLARIADREDTADVGDLAPVRVGRDLIVVISRRWNRRRERLLPVRRL